MVIVVVIRSGAAAELAGGGGGVVGLGVVGTVIARQPVGLAAVGGKGAGFGGAADADSQAHAPIRAAQPVAVSYAFTARRRRRHEEVLVAWLEL